MVVTQGLGRSVAALRHGVPVSTRHGVHDAVVEGLAALESLVVEVTYAGSI